MKHCLLKFIYFLQINIEFGENSNQGGSLGSFSSPSENCNDEDYEKSLKNKKDFMLKKITQCLIDIEENVLKTVKDISNNQNSSYSKDNDQRKNVLDEVYKNVLNTVSIIEF